MTCVLIKFNFQSAEKATNENNTQEKWGLIMEVCDKVTNGAASSKECLKNIVKRLNHSDPHVVIQAITVSFINLIVKIKIDDDFVG